MLHIQNLTVTVEQKKILSDVSLQCQKGSIIALLGHNGSGKSSLLHTIMGSPVYEVQQGIVMYNDQNIIDMPVEKRAHNGIFLTLQQPFEIPGVRVNTLLKESFRACHPQLSLDVYIDRLSEACSLLSFDRSYLDRAVHAGFSGGEKKKLEALQAYILQPSLLLLDEIDSGLDSDARHVVGTLLQTLKKQSPEMTIIMVTHHTTLAQYLPPDQVYRLHNGTIVQSGTQELFYEIQQNGYER